MDDSATPGFLSALHQRRRSLATQSRRHLSTQLSALGIQMPLTEVIGESNQVFIDRHHRSRHGEAIFFAGVIVVLRSLMFFRSIPIPGNPLDSIRETQAASR